MSIVDDAKVFVTAKPDLSAVLNSLKDKSIPLDERWEAFEILVNGNVFNKIETYGDGYIDTLVRVDGKESTLYDNFYIERHETTKFPDMLEKILEPAWKTNEMEYTPESIVKWKEKVLASGNSGFTNDW